MKNLKKALSVMLAAAIMCSLFAINAGAVEYPDAADIEHSDAVNVLTSLGIFSGYDDGTFQPDTVITRAQMCKVICLSMNGGNDPILGADAASLFSDTTGHWANAYIAYCYNLGIVSGDAGAGGTFRPDDTVTSAEATKMVLVALGYDATLSGFTGESWSINVAVSANQKNLYEKLAGVSLSTGMTRDNAAQLIYNGINAIQVEYTYTLITVDGVLTSTAKAVNKGGSPTMLSANFAVTEYTGVVTANEKATSTGTSAAILDKGYTGIDTGIDTDNDNDNDNDIDLTFKVSTGADLIGKSVSIYAKNLKNGAYQDVYGDPIVSSATVVTYTTSFSTVAKLTDALKALDIKTMTGAVVVENYVKSVGTPAIVAGADAGMTSTSGLMGAGKAVTIINNSKSDTTADYVIVTALTAGKVVTYSTSGDGYISVNTLAGAAAFTGQKAENVVGYENIAKDDIVLYYNIGTKYYVEKAASSVVTPVSTTGTSKVTAAGTTYEASSLTTVYSSGGATTLAAAVTLNKDATLYMDNYGYVVYVDTVNTTTNYLLVTDVSTAGAGVFATSKIKAVLDDGIIVTVDVLSVNNVKITAGGAVTDDRIYSYTVDSTGSYKLSTAFTADASVTAISNNNANLTGASFVANDKTIFVVKTGTNTYTAYTGIANAPSMTGATTSSYCKTTGTATIVFVTATTLSGSTGKTVYILDATPTVTLDDTKYTYSYKALVNGVATDLISTETTSPATAVTVGLYSSVTLNTAGKFDPTAAPFNAAPTSAAKAISCKDGVLSIVGATSAYTYNSDTTVITIDGKTATTTAIGEVIVIDTAAPFANNSNVIVIPTKNSSGVNTTVADTVYIVKGISSAAVPTSVNFLAHATNGATVTGAPVTVVSTAANTAGVTGFADGIADCVKFDITAAASTTATATLAVGTAAATAYTSGSSIDVGAATGTVVYTLNVYVSGTGVATTVYTYVLTVTVA